ncbi:TetR family transcriptional regulator [Aquibacillus halophilus]|uniref:TetR family transcriptional regulator n=1 Tax=Aquibacillus halophilus TaxID=930132 RepID=A0A6A8DGQ6_9BACI|nr:TetR/AcrR family transcriptional regulator [Aquibacillus halophilus]MRH43696.1 TetR family transcriptional regulator [Aquibacillus halophilus]
MDEKYVKQLLEMEGQELKLTEKKVNILVAAIEIFAEKGYSATSTSEIAKRAGVAEGTIFRHYDSKKDLLLGITKPAILKMVVPYFASQMVEEVFKDEITSFDGVLRAFITNRIEFVRKNIPLFKIVLQEIAFHNELQETFQESFLNQILPKISETIYIAQKSGRLKDFSIPTTLRFIMSTVMGFIITRFLIMPEAEWNEKEEIDNMVECIMNGISKNN